MTEVGLDGDSSNNYDEQDHQAQGIQPVDCISFTLGFSFSIIALCTRERTTLRGAGSLAHDYPYRGIWNYDPGF